MNIVSECIGVDAIALHSVTSVIKLIATCRKLQKISSLPIIGIQLLNAIVIILIVYSDFFLSKIGKHLRVTFAKRKNKHSLFMNSWFYV